MNFSSCEDTNLVERSLAMDAPMAPGWKQPHGLRICVANLTKETL